MATWTLKFEVAPDNEGASGDTANGQVHYRVPRGAASTLLDGFTTLGATPPTFNWQLRTYDVSAWFNPDDTRISIERTASNDSVHIRRLRVEGAGGLVLYGGWPEGFGAYPASAQDGVLGREYLGQDIGVGASDFRGEQYSLDTRTYVNPNQSLDWYFTTTTIPTVGFIGFGLMP